MAKASGPDPCRQCGACCAHYRVSFYWAEGEALPEDKVQRLSATWACMAGTHQAQPRCSALEGEVGQGVFCTVYEHRTSPCREVQPGDERCNQARRHYQMPPLT